MTKLKIPLPKKFLFSTELKVRIGDINYGGHLGNDVIALYVNESRVQFLRFLGYENEMNIEKLGMIMTDSTTVFKSEGFYGNRIKAQVTATNFERCSFDFVFLFHNISTGKDLAITRTGFVFFDYETKKVRSIPQPFLKKLKG